MTAQLIHRRHLKQYIGDAKSILDVGCGNKPLRVATCIADKFPDTYTHKGKVHTENPKGMIKMLPGVKFVEATLPNLPFKDKEFDFVFCSHVIEHVDDVAAGLQELARVARRGYLECPRWWFEYVDCTPFHKWFIDFDGTELVCKKKTGVEMQHLLDRRIFDKARGTFDQLYRTYDATFIEGIDKPKHRAFEKVRRMLAPKRYPSLEEQMRNKQFAAVCLYWEDSIPFRIVPSSQYAT
jgi:ubiquinone/menaquinone biosynthesis C-methylase UbiE